MAISLHDATIKAFTRSLTNLSAFLKKGESHLDENSTPHSKLLEARLVPDMYPLTYQIQRVSDTAKGAAVRLAGMEPVSMPDSEATIEDLQARITKTLDLLKTVSEDSMAGKEGKEVVIKTMKGEVKFTGKSYVLDYAVPNFYFHVNMAYAILRMQGVPVGKGDYLGPL